MSEKPPAESGRSSQESGELPLEAFETKILLRPTTLDDYEQIVEMAKICFPGMQPWGKDQIQSQLDVFPDGQVCIEYQGAVVASCSSLIVDFDLHDEWHDWREIADGGYIRNHDPEGDTLYGIEIMVHPKYRGMRLARRLYEARKEIARRYNLARSIIGGRIPGYGKYADELSPREYVEKVVSRGLYDPVLTTQVANGFVLKKLIPNYFPSDTASRGYATHLEWNNLDYVEETAQRRMQSVAFARVCAVQYEMRHLDSFDDFCRQCEYFLDTASDSKSDFVLFPELITTQLLAVDDAKQRPSDAARALAEYTPRYLEFFTRMSIKYNVNIIGGTQFTVEDDHLYNIAYLFRRDGTIEKQYKLHIPPAERRWWGLEPGDSIEVFDTDRGKVAILMGYDIEFPEIARVAVARGARILFVPFSTENRHSYLRVRYCAQARAVENNLYVAISGATGNLPFVQNADVHYAQSGIFTPLDFSFARDGIAGECTPNIETLVIHDVDLELLRRHRHMGTFQPWEDRRTSLYSIRYQDPEEHEPRHI